VAVAVTNGGDGTWLRPLLSSTADGSFRFVPRGLEASALAAAWQSGAGVVSFIMVELLVPSRRRLKSTALGFRSPTSDSPSELLPLDEGSSPLRFDVELAFFFFFFLFFFLPSLFDLFFDFVDVLLPTPLSSSSSLACNGELVVPKHPTSRQLTITTVTRGRPKRCLKFGKLARLAKRASEPHHQAEQTETKQTRKISCRVGTCFGPN
jgi:hypothetical protein